MDEDQQGISLLGGRESREKRVLVGMTGGVGSTVVAFLLKNQGFEVAGASLSLLEEGRGLPCHVDATDGLESVCEGLGIPLHRVKAHQEFEEGVLDPVVGARLDGRFSSTCINCQEIKLRILSRKASELGYPWIATGHFAKLQINPVSQAMELYPFQGASKEDQSHLLCRVGQEYLENLLLPLGDLNEQMVLTLVERYKLHTLPRAKREESCFFQGDRVRDLMEKTVGLVPSYRKSAYLVSSGDRVLLGQLTDNVLPFYHFYLGMEGINFSKPVQLPPDPVVTEIFPAQKMVALGGRKELNRSQVMVKRLRCYGDLDRIRPRVLGVKFESGPCQEGVIFFKNNGVACVELSSPLYNKGWGHVAVFYSGLEKNAKVLASGIVDFD